MLFASQGAFAFDLQAHRGGRGLAPENTLAAFEQALKAGVNTLELDVGLTVDGVVVVSHDSHLNPDITRDAGGQWLQGSKGPPIKALTLAQLAAYDVGRIKPGTAYARQFADQQAHDGERIPELAAVFDLVRARQAQLPPETPAVRFNIETKLSPLRPDDTANPGTLTLALLKAVREAGMSRRVTVQSFDWRTLRLVQQLEPGMPTACLSNQSASGNTLAGGAWTAGLDLAAHGSVPQLVKAAGCSTWSPNSSALTQELVREAHLLGLLVLPWTVNEPADMQRLLGWGVDGMITDYPDRLCAAVAQRGLRQ